jgi:putative CocE/NonD family hydrolase
MRRLVTLLVLALAAGAGLPVAAAPPAWTARPATYEIVQQRDVRITMSDGVRLRADVYFPGKGGTPAAGRFPVVLTQTPYNKTAPGLNFHSAYLVQRGYVQVVADVRGTGGSEGMWDSFGSREQRDGAELVRWAATQPWSDGRVALHGTSYAAINQIFTAAQRPAGLKAIFPVVPMADSYRDISVTGGQNNTSFIPLWLGLVTGGGLLPPTATAQDPVAAATTLGQHAANVANFPVPVVADAATGGDIAYDGPFHRQRSPIEAADRVDVPAFLVGGWYDLFQRGTPLLYERLAKRSTPTRLLMGPWYHITAGEGLPTDGVRDLDELELRWFDRHVRGVADPELDREAPVTYYRLGQGHYHRTSSWPPAGAVATTVHLSGQARQGAPGGLSFTAPTASGTSSVPWHPFGGMCSRSPAQWTASGQDLGCKDDQRANELAGVAFELPPAKHARTFAGPIAAALSVSTNGRDAMLAVRVEDVAPDGAITQLTAGWQVLSLNKPTAARDTMALNGKVLRPWHPFTRASKSIPGNGEVRQVWVEVFPTAAVVAAGHRLRVSIQPSDTPHLTAPAPQAVDLAGSVLTIHTGPRHPSFVNIAFTP